VTAGIPPVRHTIEVPVDEVTAFEVFTSRMGEWWPREHRIGSSRKVDIVVESGTGGWVLEVGEDGSQCQTGRVVAWEPPRRLVVLWQITPRWTPEPDPDRCSEYEVTFTPAGDRTTLVAVEHRDFERHGDGGGDVAAAVDSPNGWPHVLAGFAAVVGADT
jgi:uncharacterized protein YndB with AHSA1/START domain